MTQVFTEEGNLIPVTVVECLPNVVLQKKTVETEYGAVEVSILNIESKKVAFISRHLEGHKIPPHMINYKANIQALKNLGVTQIISTSAVGSINLDMAPGSFVIIITFF